MRPTAAFILALLLYGCGWSTLSSRQLLIGWALQFVWLVQQSSYLGRSELRTTTTHQPVINPSSTRQSRPSLLVLRSRLLNQLA